jgi:hypothetical protein
LIDGSLAAMLQGGVSIGVAACDHELNPTLVRATGCRISSDRRQATIFVSATQAAPLLRCVRDNGAVAVVFSQPSTHRSVQLKGRDAAVSSLAQDDLKRIEDYRNAFTREVGPLGFDEILVHSLLAYPSADIVSVTFTVSEAFEQTPGPKAGEPLRTPS